MDVLLKECAPIKEIVMESRFRWSRHVLRRPKTAFVQRIEALQVDGTKGVVDKDLEGYSQK